MSFSPSICELLSDDAAGKCSAPHCRAETGRPGGRSPNGGEGAHIKGERPGTARYDPYQSEDDRQGETNGIWLCPTCHRLIDRYVTSYDVELLHEWKRLAAQHREGIFLRPQYASGNVSLTDEISRVQLFLQRHAKLLDALISLRDARPEFGGRTMISDDLRTTIFSFSSGMRRVNWNRTADDYCHSPEFNSKQCELLRLLDKLNSFEAFKLFSKQPYVDMRMKYAAGEYEFFEPAAEVAYALMDYLFWFNKIVKS